VADPERDHLAAEGEVHHRVVEEHHRPSLVGVRTDLADCLVVVRSQAGPEHREEDRTVPTAVAEAADPEHLAAGHMDLKVAAVPACWAAPLAVGPEEDRIDQMAEAARS
jgi:hypothetical protein